MRIAFCLLRCFGSAQQPMLSNRCSLQCFGGSTTLTNRILSDRNLLNKKISSLWDWRL